VDQVFPKLEVAVGESSLSLESHTRGWQAVSAVRAKQDSSSMVAALASCSSFTDGKIYVKLNEGSSGRIKIWNTSKSLGTSTATIPLVLRKVFEKEFSCPLANTMVLDLSILETGLADLGAMSINATSLALFSTLFRGEPPVAAVSVAVVKDKVVLSPNSKQMAQASMYMIYAGRKGDPVYFHASGKVSLDVLLSALQAADAEVSRVAGAMRAYIEADVPSSEAEVCTREDLVALARVRDYVDEDVGAFVASQNFNIHDLDAGLGRLKAKCSDYFRKIGAFRSPVVKVTGSGCVTEDELNVAFNESVKDAVTRRIKSKRERIDGRAYGDVRRAYFDPEKSGLCAVDKGSTKSISTVSITSSKSMRTFDCTHTLAVSAASSHLRNSRRHMKALEFDLIQVELESNLIIEKAFYPVLPEFEDFPYYIKTKSQALSMDGSVPTTNVCGSSIALANAGVPLESHIAGVSVGILTQAEEGAEPIMLLDPIDLEERLVDGLVMLTASATDVTSASLEGVKSRVSFDAMVGALRSAIDAKEGILESMNEVCPLNSNPNQGSFFEKIAVPKASIGKVIGPGGSNLKKIEGSTGVIVSIQDEDNTVSVYGGDSESCKEAIQMIMKVAGIGPKLEEGKAYKAKVVKILEYGAIVELEVGGDGWIHISEIRQGHVKKVSEELSVGQPLDVICIGKNARGQPQMSLKAAAKASSK